MKVFSIAPSAMSKGRIVALFGCGLIGSRIQKEFERRQAECLLDLKAAWKDHGVFRGQCHELQEFVMRLILAHQVPVHFIWSAGSGSFSSTTDTLTHEQRTYEHALQMISLLATATPSFVHFISSAGGLFEGQRLVGPDSRPEPIRPYGLMKLNQENLLARQAAQAGFQFRIYRPSTVYGTREFGFRAGLVSHLFWNALRNMPTTLEANFHALRDYVHASDIAAYIAGQVMAVKPDAREIQFLVSGKPSSIFEIVRMVERMMGRALVLHYSDRVQNDRDITFRSGIVPAGWRPHDLETGLRTVFRNTSFLYLRDFSHQVASR